MLLQLRQQTTQLGMGRLGRAVSARVPCCLLSDVSALHRHLTSEAASKPSTVGRLPRAKESSSVLPYATEVTVAS
jgi:hypothetical protein